jgi:hypothetical protein
MSIFEWLGEMFDPGPVGTVDGPGPVFGGMKKILVGIFSAGGLALFIMAIWWIATTPDITAWKWYLSFSIYLAFSWAVTPRPDNRNLGWFGGFMDHPFRFSDDLNRMLVFAYILLFPGKLMVAGILFPFYLYKTRTRK